MPSYAAALSPSMHWAPSGHKSILGAAKLACNPPEGALGYCTQTTFCLSFCTLVWEAGPGFTKIFLRKIHSKKFVRIFFGAIL